MAGPFWLAAVLGTLMLVTAAYCAGRLLCARWWRRSTETDVDATHVAMGSAMVGMFVPELDLLPSYVWEVVFAAMAAWFAWRTTRSYRRRNLQEVGHRVPHLVGTIAMVYMFQAMPVGSAVRPQEMSATMHAHSSATVPFPALAFLLAVFMVCSVGSNLARLAPTVGAVGEHHAGEPVLAPRLATCSDVVMGVAMAYMLLHLVL